MVSARAVRAAGSTHGVTREEIDAAFAWLTSPYVAAPFGPTGSARQIIIRQR